MRYRLLPGTPKSGPLLTKMIKLEKLGYVGRMYVTQFAIKDGANRIIGGVTVGIQAAGNGDAFVMGLHPEKDWIFSRRELFRIARQLRAAYPRVDAFWAYHQKYKEYRRFKLPRVK